MRIVHINLFDQQGGAARIANQLADYMRSKGHTVHQFAFIVSQPNEFTIPIPRPSETNIKMFQQLAQKHGMLDFFMPYLLSVIEHPLYKQADVVHLHCINGEYFSYLLLPFLAKKRLLWTLHDTLAFTAHCLYPHICGNWQAAYCADCPLDGGRPAPLNRPLMQQLKENILRQMKVKLIAPSHWIAEMVGRSVFRTQELQLIYNGVDTRIYKPGSQAAVRQRWNLPPDAFVLMFAAHGGLANEMKGGRFMLAALQLLQVKYPDLVFLQVGGDQPELLKDISLRTHSLPYIDDEHKMAELYAAADLFVSTSLTESFGLTVCEAMACGVPVVSFATGGLKEIIDDPGTGCLVPAEDVAALVQAISAAVSHPEQWQEKGRKARERIEQRFSVDVFCREYEKVYESVF